MPLADYSDSIGGGLKLKGVKDGRVKKHKKKKVATDTPSDIPTSTTDERDGQSTKDPDSTTVTAGSTGNKYGKTEAQLRHEERKRKMEDDRARREGTKSHKEKVEELNKYLSKLSEHHDMPRIGPG